MVKQTKLWMLAAIFAIISGATVFIACAKDDNPVVNTKVSDTVMAWLDDELVFDEVLKQINVQ